MSQVQLNAEELKTFIKHIVTNNQAIQADGKIPVALAVTGDAGLGKTSSILQAGEELGLEVVKLNLAQIEEIGDLVGFPIKEFEIKRQEDGVVKWIPESLLETYIKHKYIPSGRNRMSYAAPEWIEGKQEGLILLLDDFNRADNRFLQAAMELIDRQTYVSWKLPKNSHIILSQNPDNGDYNVNTQDVAQQTRYISVNMKFDVNVWAKWAETVNIDGRCINFMLMHPELVSQKVNPRSITTFFNSISSIQKFEDELPLIQMIGEGSVGIEFSSMFTMFINNKLDRIISPEDIINNKNEAYVIGALNSAFGVDDDYRADIASVLATRVINYLTLYSNSNPITDDIVNRIVKLTTDCESFTTDLKYYLVKEIVNSNKTKFSKLMMNTEVIKMAVK
jgi:hypothetical protein